jgi:hypothetical protein
MPLAILARPEELASALSVMQLRAVTAEQNAANLRLAVDNLSANQQSLVQSSVVASQYAANQAGANAVSVVQAAAAVSPDLDLQSFIASLGMSVALAEASMPDRAIASVAATVQSYLTFNTPVNGTAQVVGLSLYQPELGTPGALASISFELAKVPSETGAPAPRNLYLVLQDKQVVFSAPFWSPFSTGTPPSQPATLILAELTKMFASIGVWTFPYLLQEATTIAGFEQTLASLFGAAGRSAPAAAYAAAVNSLVILTSELNSRSAYVAGDLYALTAALDATTTSAKTLLP